MLHFLVPASDPTVTPDPFHVEMSRPNSGLQLSSRPSTPKRGSDSGGDRHAVSTWAKTQAPAHGQRPWDRSAGESRTPQPHRELKLLKNLI